MSTRDEPDVDMPLSAQESIALDLAEARELRAKFDALVAECEKTKTGATLNGLLPTSAVLDAAWTKAEAARAKYAEVAERASICTKAAEHAVRVARACDVDRVQFDNAHPFAGIIPKQLAARNDLRKKYAEAAADARDKEQKARAASDAAAVARASSCRALAGAGVAQFDAGAELENLAWRIHYTAFDASNSLRKRQRANLQTRKAVTKASEDAAQQQTVLEAQLRMLSGKQDGYDDPHRQRVQAQLAALKLEQDALRATANMLYEDDRQFDKAVDDTVAMDPTHWSSTFRHAVERNLWANGRPAAPSFREAVAKVRALCQSP
jgi:hypothetical protein